MHTNTPIENLRNESGLPLGGIGAGKIEFCWDGRFTNITTNNNMDCPIYNGKAGFPLLPRIREGAPGSYEENSQRRQSITDLEGLPGGWLAFYNSVDGGRVLKVHGRPNFDCLNQNEIDFSGRFPVASVLYPGFKGCTLKLNAFSSFMVPDLSNEYQDSSLPLAFFQFEIENVTNIEIQAGVALSWQNLNGIGGYPGVPINNPDKTKPIFRDDAQMPGLWFDHDPDTKEDGRVIGDYSLRCKCNHKTTEYSYCAGWEAEGHGKDVWETFAEKGKLNNADLPYTAGALAATIHLLPKEKTTVIFTLSWNMPNLIAAETEWQYLVRPSGAAPAPNSQNRKNYGHAYNRWFKNSWDIAEYGLKNWEETLEEIQKWQNGLLNTSLPKRLVDGLCNDLFPLYSSAWYTRDLLFAMNESPTDMNGCMGTIDQRGVGHAAAVMLFPKLNQVELSMFARDQIGDENDPRHFAFHHNLKTGRFNLMLNREGAILHDLGWDHLEAGRLGDSVWSSAHWPEHTSLFTLQVYQHAIWNGDQEWLDDQYPRIKKALKFQSRLDQDGDGIGDLWGPGSNTYDTELYPYYGATPYVATLYLAALQVGYKLAVQYHDKDFQKWTEEKIIQVKKSLQEKLWNPKLGYFNTWHDINYKVFDGTPEEHPLFGDQCHISQLAGEFWSKILGLENIVEPGQLESVLNAIFERNVSQVPGSPADEFRTDGSYSQSMCAFVMGYFGGLATVSGFPEYGWKAVENVYHVRYDLDGSLWDAHLQWSGPGNTKTQWGRWYFSIPASWYYLWSLTAARFNKINQELWINPNWPKAWDQQKCVLPLFLPGISANVSTEINERDSSITINIESLKEDAIPLKSLGIGLPNQFLNQNLIIDVLGLNGYSGKDNDKGKIIIHGDFNLKIGDQIKITVSIDCSK